ncbi:hypothetical protein JBW_02190 [Pelosinus fermentans JBW45]|uniref:Uncharacterized protein n=2 Tax=Pelosinus TaxID=365348 RepID=I8TU88_9FIRM|nr:hypothetical protein JBW_02190 [Pelosinus fermentans JBW45]
MNPIMIVSATLRYITNVQNVIMSVRKIGINALSVIITFIMTVIGMMNVSVLNVITNVTMIVISALGVITIFIMTVSVINVIMTAVDIIVVKRPFRALFLCKKNNHVLVETWLQEYTVWRVSFKN